MRGIIEIPHLKQLARQFPKRRRHLHDQPRKPAHLQPSGAVPLKPGLQIHHAQVDPSKRHVDELGQCVPPVRQRNCRARHIGQIGIDAGKAYAPMGAGLGTFRQAYAPFEAKHTTNLGHAVANHAHNDYAELWLEAGYPGLFAMIVFWLLFMALGVRVWWKQKQAGSFDVLLSRVAWVGVLLALLHSYADYPLRTTADASVFALLLALALACSQNKHYVENPRSAVRRDS